MRRIIVLVTVAAMMVLVASPVQAQDIPLHEHELITPGTEPVELAQGICEQELLDPALANVHEHFHLGVPVEEAFQITENPVDEQVDFACE